MPSSTSSTTNREQGTGREALRDVSESSAVDLPPHMTLRISHFPDPQRRRYWPAHPKGANEVSPSIDRLTTKGSRHDWRVSAGTWPNSVFSYPFRGVVMGSKGAGRDRPDTIPRGGSVGVRRHDPALAGLDDDEALAVEDELERLT